MKTFDSLKKLTAMIVFAVLFSNCSPNNDSTPATFPSDGLIAQYNFDGDANDSSGHDLNGTVHGATLTLLTKTTILTELTILTLAMPVSETKMMKSTSLILH